ncbi:type I-E CRISPR-associated endonuclease Cas1e [Nocardiopsis terrae]
MTTAGARGALNPSELTRAEDRSSFIYLERCLIHREDNAITAEDGEGTRHIPSATIGVLLLGPGTRVTHQAMALLGDSGAGVVWVGEQGVRYYSGGRALTRRSVFVEAQAAAWANKRTRLDVARAMYLTRFPGENVEGRSRRELLGLEGDRVRACYREQAARTGVEWKGRKFVPGRFDDGDAPNQAVTAAAQCFYGVAQSVVAALGCTPGLGFVHSGNEQSFVLDVADLYKVSVAIPVAFDVAAESDEEVGARTRRALRDRIHELGLLEQCVADVKRLLLPGGEPDGEAEETDRVSLQTDRGPDIESGRNLGVIW